MAAPAAAPRRHGRARLRLPPLSLSPGVLNFDFRLLLSRSPGRERGEETEGRGCGSAWWLGEWQVGGIYSLALVNSQVDQSASSPIHLLP